MTRSSLPDHRGVRWLRRRIPTWLVVGFLPLLAVPAPLSAQPSKSASAPATPPPAQPPKPASDPPASAQPSSPPDDAEDASGEPVLSTEVKAKVNEHVKAFGVLFKKGQYAAALAEIQAARRLYPSPKTLTAAGICLIKVQRYDEALDAFESALREGGVELDARAKAQAQQQIVRMRGLTGSISIVGAEVGALLVIDSRLRGEYPSPAPLNVMPGGHVIRIYKEGFVPLETSIDVAAKQAAAVTVKLQPLVRSGRLRVEESSGKALDLVLDGVPVGVTPWEGDVMTGEHRVLLRGEGDTGTLPSTVTIRLNEKKTISLAAEPLHASIKVIPVPATASVLLDGFFVGRGAFEGRLRPGEHSIKVAAEGYFDKTRKVRAAAGNEHALTVALERDPKSPLWQKPGVYALEAIGAFSITPSFGGDIAGGCTGDCARAVGLGGSGVVLGSYELGNGFGFGVSFGYLFAQQSVSNRPVTLELEGLTPAGPGKADDDLKLRGFRPGIFASYRLGPERRPIRFRLGAGALLGSISDSRTGTFPLSSQSTGVCPEDVAALAQAPCYLTGPVIQAPFAAFMYVEPEVRVGFRVAPRFQVSAGVSALLLFGLKVPAWDDTQAVYASRDGAGTFAAEQLMGRVVPLLQTSVGLRYEF